MFLSEVSADGVGYFSLTAASFPLYPGTALLTNQWLAATHDTSIVKLGLLREGSRQAAKGRPVERTRRWQQTGST